MVFWCSPIGQNSSIRQPISTNLSSKEPFNGTIQTWQSLGRYPELLSYPRKTRMGCRSARLKYTRCRCAPPNDQVASENIDCGPQRAIGVGIAASLTRARNGD